DWLICHKRITNSQAEIRTSRQCAVCNYAADKVQTDVFSGDCEQMHVTSVLIEEIDITERGCAYPRGIRREVSGAASDVAAARRQGDFRCVQQNIDVGLLDSAVAFGCDGQFCAGSYVGSESYAAVGRCSRFDVHVGTADGADGIDIACCFERNSI